MMQATLRQTTARAALGTALGLAVVLLPACGQRQPARPPATADLQAVYRPGPLPVADPRAAAWDTAPEHVAQLLVQDQADPRLASPSVDVVRVRALHDGNQLVWRLDWDDPTTDDLAGPGRFADGAAVQVPVQAGGDVPDAAMGQPGRPVRITLWKANAQRRLDGKGDDLAALYPHSTTDHYPYQAAGETERAALELLYAPARGAQNPVTLGRADAPTQDLVAEGFGTLTALADPVSQGHGLRDGNRWLLTIARPLDRGEGEALRPGARTYVAFAVWEGGAGNAGGRKMRSGWVAFALGETR